MAGHRLHPRGSLAESVAQYGPWAADAVLALAAGLAEGLLAIHAAGLVHRDLKPSNVLLAQDGPRVIDFGISRAVTSRPVTSTGIVIGSPRLCRPSRPEARQVGPPSDVFSLGGVLAFAATGQGPFGTGSGAAVVYRLVHMQPDLDRVPTAARTVIERCLDKDPARRPSPGDLLAELGEAALVSGWQSLWSERKAAAPPGPGFSRTEPTAPGGPRPDPPRSAVRIRAVPRPHRGLGV